jgi:hypothetical protein
MQRLSYCYLLTRALPEGGCRYYVGIRTCPVGETPRTDTKYMGGGPAIRAAVEEDRAAFTKTIVEVFETRAEAKAMERALVGLATANSPWSYNLRQGGEDHGLHSEESKAKMREVRLARSEESERLRKERAADAQRRPETRERVSASVRRGWSRVPAEEREAHAKATSDGMRRVWASYTDEQRRARGRAAAEGKRRAAERRAREQGGADPTA